MGDEDLSPEELAAAEDVVDALSSMPDDESRVRVLAWVAARTVKRRPPQRAGARKAA
jgi:hypothetical protein